MDFDIKLEEYRVSARTSAIIYNSDLTKILIFKGKDKDYYLLPGGRIKFGEDSKNAIYREIKEELGFELKYEFVVIEEIFLTHNNLSNHQYCFVYKAIYDEDIKDEFYGLEDDYQVYYWVNIKDIDKYNIKPKEIKNIILNNTNHIIINE